VHAQLLALGVADRVVAGEVAVATERRELLLDRRGAAGDLRLELRILGLERRP
jgi:hypothetical protein